MTDRFRVLCLDGGGIKGVFTAAALAHMEEKSQRQIIKHFDLIVGTSTGGILAIGLAMGFPAKELLRFYRERGPVIFPTTGLVGRSARLFRQMFVGPKLSHAVLRAELATILGNRKLGEAKCRLAIPSYDAVAGRIYVFKTAHAPGVANEADLPALDVALATSAAPTYFVAAATHGDGRFIDGGVWANNPALVGVVEAATFLNVPLPSVDILSIGTTTQPFSLSKNANASALRWNVGLLNLALEAQAEAAHAQASLLVQGRIHRVNITATEGRFALDSADPDTLGDLANLGRNEVEKRLNWNAIAERFLNGDEVVPFMPLQPAS